jgi:hypothetical protein
MSTFYGHVVIKKKVESIRSSRLMKFYEGARIYQLKCSKIHNSTNIIFDGTQYIVAHRT